MVRILSHVMRKGDPGWPGNPTFNFEQYTKISEHGEPANTYRLDLFNHFGSHMDGPNHFNPSGKQLYEIPAEEFVFKSALLIDVNRGADDLITIDDIEQYTDQIVESDAILFRTHFTKYRFSDSQKYASHGPGVSPELCEYLVKNYPALKAIALDFISLAAYQKGTEGVLAHQWMLGNFHEKYILIIEDLNFEDLTQAELGTVIALPLRIAGIDSAPCTVIALSERLN